MGQSTLRVSACSRGLSAPLCFGSPLCNHSARCAGIFTLSENLCSLRSNAEFVPAGKYVAPYMESNSRELGCTCGGGQLQDRIRVRLNSEIDVLQENITARITDDAVFDLFKKLSSRTLLFDEETEVTST